MSPATGVAHRAARDDSSDYARDDGHDDDHDDDDARRREVERAADGDASTRGRRGDATRDGDGARVVHGAWVRMRDRCARGRRGGDDDGDGDDASTTRHRAVDDRGWGDWKTERARRGDMEIRASAHDSRDFARYDGDRVEDFDGEPEMISMHLVPRALLGLLALLMGNGYIVGINQIYDVDIDKVNKPFLPVASGELSVFAAWAFCAVTALGGAAIVATNFGALITKLYCFGLFLGTIYSVPPLRLKQYALPAFLIIACVRGFLLNFGVYHATRAAIGLPFVWSPAITFITIFVTTFATVIAITKDLPDIEGDLKYKIETFSTRLGVKKVSYIGSGLLLANYIFAIALSVKNPTWFIQPLMIGGHALFASFLIVKTKALENAKFSRDAILQYYRDIWALFYSEYFLFPWI